MIVVTLTKVPRSLRGDLTKWYQEIQTGVYVGNVSARIRDMLWDRIMKNIGHGEATMVYNSNNELGYTFRTTRKDRDVVDFDGIPLMMHLNEATGPVKHGFSNAAKFHQAKVMTRKLANKKPVAAPPTLIAIDLETTGLDPIEDEIMAIGAVKRVQGRPIERFYQLIQIDKPIPKNVMSLTGLTSELLNEKGVSLAAGLQGLKTFIGDTPLIGYNLHFDETFLTAGFKRNGLPDLGNRMVDLMPVVKKANKFLDKGDCKI
ncbi:type I-E CRISPR-associated endoribonuclease Cas2e [Levilactobacillus humaensis]|uniref:type I-E CRISPR-associated endoribonuclease Cas2e n=1 Tax=Levilactobacillus humaensis TaxID=2950375 RepID=UPI0021C3D8C6|nr:type I-E CRISPR-associated endoribonuclease Cas2e [Levilactobacillus humaensis]